jgi:hypothetical protein
MQWVGQVRLSLKRIRSKAIRSKCIRSKLVQSCDVVSPKPVEIHIQVATVRSINDITASVQDIGPVILQRRRYLIVTIEQIWTSLALGVYPSFLLRQLNRRNLLPPSPLSWYNLSPYLEPPLCARHNRRWQQSLSLILAIGKAVSDWRHPLQTSSGCQD